ncbi:MAG: TolC family protein [Muribaculaceae bacterium]|nr:TolC family protein [Muribaculaceae bacterium]
MKKSLNIAFVAAAFSISSINALDFNSVVELAVAVNPEIAVSTSQSIAELSLLQTENNLDNPEISFEGLFTPLGENKYNIELSQSFDWPGVYAARRQQLNTAKLLADYNIQIAKNDCRMQAAEAIITIIGSKLKIAELSDILERYNVLKQTYIEAQQRGNITKLDLNKLLIEIADLEASIAEENYSLNQARSTLAAICGGSESVMNEAEHLTSLPEGQLLSVNDYITTAAANSPKIAAAKAQTSLSGYEMKTIAKENLPGFTLGYRFAREDGVNFNGFTFGMSIPSWGNRGKKAAAQASINASTLAERATETSIEQQIIGIHNSASNLKSQIDTYGSALIATDNIALLDRAYKTGQITLTDYIQDTHYFHEAQNRLTDLRMRYANQIMQLAIISGL